MYREIVQQLKYLEKSIKELEEQRKTIFDHMTALENQGLIYASTYYRNEKYLYLIYPMVDGKRKREYVGCDPQKIEDAKVGIARGHEYDRLKRQLDTVEGQKCGMLITILIWPLWRLDKGNL
jgi:hypothetical protein